MKEDFGIAKNGFFLSTENIRPNISAVLLVTRNGQNALT